MCIRDSLSGPARADACGGRAVGRAIGRHTVGAARESHGAVAVGRDVAPAVGLCREWRGRGQRGCCSRLLGRR
eukprot:405892-Prymnesium_polylepis.1